MEFQNESKRSKINDIDSPCTSHKLVEIGEREHRSQFYENCRVYTHWRTKQITNGIIFAITFFIWHDICRNNSTYSILCWRLCRMFPGMQTMGAITNKLRYEDSSNINIDLKYLCGVTPSLFISKFTKAKSIQITNTKDLPFHTVGDQLSNITTFDWTIQNKLVSHLFLPLLSKMNNLESLNLEYHQNMGDIFSVLNTLEKLQFLTLSILKHTEIDWTVGTTCVHACCSNSLYAFNFVTLFTLS